MSSEEDSAFSDNSSVFSTHILYIDANNLYNSDPEDSDYVSATQDSETDTVILDSDDFDSEASSTSEVEIVAAVENINDARVRDEAVSAITTYFEILAAELSIHVSDLLQKVARAVNHLGESGQNQCKYIGNRLYDLHFAHVRANIILARLRLDYDNARGYTAKMFVERDILLVQQKIRAVQVERELLFNAFRALLPGV
jgi:hypothetical protein